MTDIEMPDVIGATRRAETIRIGMVGWAAAQDAIAEAFEAKDWITLGYKSWSEYVEKEFAEKRLKLTRDQRSEAVEVFRLVGMSQREIAGTLGVGVGTINRELNPSVPNGTPEAAQSEPPADPLSEVPAAEQAVNEFLNTQTSGLVGTSPVDESGEDHPAPPLGDAADVAGARDLGDETGEQEEPPVASLPVDEPEPSGAGVSRSAPATPRAETAEEQAAREEREYREARSLEFATGVVNVRMRLEPDPVRWYQNVYLHGVYHARDLPRVRDSFTPTGLRQAARFLETLADHLEEIGEEL